MLGKFLKTHLFKLTYLYNLLTSVFIYKCAYVIEARSYYNSVDNVMLVRANKGV